MRCSQRLAVLNQELLVDLNHPVPVVMLLIKFDEDLVASDESSILYVARVPASSVDADIDFFSLVEVMITMMADCKTDRDVNGTCTEMMWQSSGASPRNDEFPDQRERSLGDFDCF